MKICKKHKDELLTKWNGFAYRHKRRNRNGEIFCSMPQRDNGITPYEQHAHNEPLSEQETKLVTLESAFAFLLLESEHLHVGLRMDFSTFDV